MEADSWMSATEVMEFLDQVFGNPNEVEEARAVQCSDHGEVPFIPGVLA